MTLMPRVCGKDSLRRHCAHRRGKCRQVLIGYGQHIEQDALLADAADHRGITGSQKTGGLFGSHRVCTTSAQLAMRSSGNAPPPANLRSARACRRRGGPANVRRAPEERLQSGRASGEPALDPAHPDAASVSPRAPRATSCRGEWPAAAGEPATGPRRTFGRGSGRLAVRQGACRRCRSRVCAGEQRLLERRLGAAGSRLQQTAAEIRDHRQVVGACKRLSSAMLVAEVNPMVRKLL